MNTTITTNGKPRDLLHWEELTAKEQKEFDYIKPDEAGFQFIRYRGWVYNIDDMMQVRNETLPAGSFLVGWDGYQGDSYFSGVLLRWVGDQVVMGTWTC